MRADQDLAQAPCVFNLNIIYFSKPDKKGRIGYIDKSLSPLVKYYSTTLEFLLNKEEEMADGNTKKWH